MNKLGGLLFALVLIAAPFAGFAQVEANAGSINLGIHIDLDYRWSAKSLEKAGPGEIRWPGYSSITGQDVFFELSGQAGDRLSYKVLEGLVPETWTATYSGQTLDIHVQPTVKAAPLEAWVELKALDQLKFRAGEMIAPTLFASTGVHMANVIHTVNAPLISSPVLGFNEALVNATTTAAFPRVWLPVSVTGLAAIISFRGFELNYTVFDNWLLPAGDVVAWGNAGYDFNKQMGNLVALTYKGEAGPGKLAARAFYFGESTVLGNGALNPVDDFGWGFGLMYNANRYFVGGEYANSTLIYRWNPVPLAVKARSNNWWGYYVTAGGKFSNIQPVYRLDSIKYSNLQNDQVASALRIDSIDQEIWHTFALNYLINDNTTVGINYVLKYPEKGKGQSGYPDEKQPNINELLIMVELNTL